MNDQKLKGRKSFVRFQRRSLTREAFLVYLSDEIASRTRVPVLRVAIDGVDGAGKTTLADELVPLVERHGLQAVRASVDSFHQPRAKRYARGEDSPEGFFQDSFDHVLLESLLLCPLAPGGSGRYRVAAFNHLTDTAVAACEERVRPPAVLLFDGIFLHRPELRLHWDYSIFLRVSPEESVRRCNEREGALHLPLDPAAAVHKRYVAGQRLYLDSCEPECHADLVIDNENPAVPVIIR